MALSHLPGLPLVDGVAMGIGAMSVVMLRLPLTSVLLASLLLASDGLAVMPLVIVAVVVAYVLSARLTPKPAAAGEPKPGPASEPAPPAPEAPTQAGPLSWAGWPGPAAGNRSLGPLPAADLSGLRRRSVNPPVRSGPGSGSGIILVNVELAVLDAEGERAPSSGVNVSTGPSGSLESRMVMT